MPFAEATIVNIDVESEMNQLEKGFTLYDAACAILMAGMLLGAALKFAL
jgi:hypothetical protein